MNMIRAFAADAVEVTKLVTVSLQVQDGEGWSTLRSLTPDEGKLAPRVRNLQRQMRRWQLTDYFGAAEFRIIEAPYVPPRLRL